MSSYHCSLYTYTDNDHLVDFLKSSGYIPYSTSRNEKFYQFDKTTMIISDNITRRIQNEALEEEFEKQAPDHHDLSNLKLTEKTGPILDRTRKITAYKIKECNVLKTDKSYGTIFSLSNGQDERDSDTDDQPSPIITNLREKGMDDIAIFLIDLGFKFKKQVRQNVNQYKKGNLMISFIDTTKDEPLFGMTSSSIDFVKNYKPLSEDQSLDASNSRSDLKSTVSETSLKNSSNFSGPSTLSNQSCRTEGSNGSIDNSPKNIDINQLNLSAKDSLTSLSEFEGPSEPKVFLVQACCITDDLISGEQTLLQFKEDVENINTFMKI
ncbi:hypothetical protein M153_3200012185 [Pseudoloma neurophilia]|uniref:Uncharacterized protein n=1 Tax=Pseudoloma neurophilia TaxID=146866 RepID=A0A0R0M0X3_9MICR|nr:hypothetical protein M153_3200012185 [Pseudoloma neurophilia]